MLERRQSRSSDVIGNFKHTSHIFSNVSIVDFKQANVCWEPDWYKIIVFLEETMFDCSFNKPFIKHVVGVFACK